MNNLEKLCRTTMLSSFFVSSLIPQANASVVSPLKIYELAKSNKTEELSAIKNINTADAKGNTALCYSILKDDAEAYQYLKRAGADTEASCVDRIPKKQYETFISAHHLATKSFLGVSSKAWLLAGLGVAGAAAALGGGGGGSSSNTESVIPEPNPTPNPEPNPEPNPNPELPSAPTTLENYNNQTISKTNTSNDPLYGRYYGSDYADISYVGNAGAGKAKIELISESDAPVYGIYSEVAHVSNADSELIDKAFNIINVSDTVGTISITNISNGNAYGIYARNDAKNAVSYPGFKATGKIYITNYENGSVYGMYSETGHLENASGYWTVPLSESYSYALIDIVNKGSGIAYGMYAKEKGVSISGQNTYGRHSQGIIKIDNEDSGEIYGVVGTLKSYSYSEIILTNRKSGKAIGVQGSIASKNDNIFIYNHENGTVLGLQGGNSSNVSINNYGRGTAIGQIGTNLIGHDKNYNDGFIFINNFDKGSVVGVTAVTENSRSASYNRAKNGSSSETSNIVINNIGDGLAVGMTINVDKTLNIADPNYVEINNKILNYANITINNIGNGTAIGMYAPAGSIAENSGTITIKREAVTIDDTIYTPSSVTGGTAYGIYAEAGATVENTGTIILEGCKTCEEIKLNGAVLANMGTIQAATLDLTAAGGTVTAAQGAKFNIAGTLSGTLNVSSDYVSGGFDTVYTARDVINAGNTARLKLASESALFDASLADNKQDIVLRMKPFNTVTNNRSLERFLENNYANARNENFFNTLKAATSASRLKSTLNKLTGENGLKRFISDDLLALRTNKFALNNEIFSHNSNEKSWTFLGNVASFGFKNDNSSNSRAALLNNRISDKLSVGYGMSYSAISTNDAKGNNRKSSTVQFYIPMTYSNKALRFVSMPSFGYAKNNYMRSGFDMSYNGEIKSRTFAFANESRYKIEFAGLTIEPAAEFNAVIYNQSGKEDIKAFALTIPNSTSFSVESGAGIHLSKQIQTDKNASITFKTGAMLYHEFAKPYNVKLGMNGMQGTFDLYDDTKRNRAEIGFGLAYKRKNIDLFADIRHFAETETHTYIKIGATLDF